jgi:hypothetical protein
MFSQSLIILVTPADFIIATTYTYTSIRMWILFKKLEISNNRSTKLTFYQWNTLTHAVFILTVFFWAILCRLFLTLITISSSLFLIVTILTSRIQYVIWFWSGMMFCIIYWSETILIGAERCVWNCVNRSCRIRFFFSLLLIRIRSIIGWRGSLITRITKFTGIVVNWVEYTWIIYQGVNKTLRGVCFW